MVQQGGSLSATERTASALWGVSLSLVAMRRGNLFWRVLSGLAGTVLLARSYAGYCGMKAALTGEATLLDGLSKQWDRMRGVGLDEQGGLIRAASSEQAIDAAVNDSFPASDPPASRLPDEPPSNAAAKWAAARTTGRF